MTIARVTSVCIMIARIVLLAIPARMRSSSRAVA